MIVFYAVSALICAILPVGRKNFSSGESRQVYICADAVHSDVVLPLHDDSVNWKKYFGDLVDPTLPADAYLEIGWGDQVFFTQYQTWTDVRIKGVFAALTGQNPTALRVLLMNEPKNDTSCVSLLMGREARIKLAQYVAANLKHPAVPTVVKSRYEAYFETQGTYGPFSTCNQWTSTGLGVAGESHALFSPFSFGVMWPLRN